MRSILCIGEALIDFICTDKGQPLQHGHHFLKKAGGAPVNVAAAIAAMGGDAHVCCTVGKDPFGDHLVATFRQFGIDTSLCHELPQVFTTLAFVSLLESGERDFYFSRGADALLSVEMVRAIDFPRYGMVHFGSATAFLPGPLQQAYLTALEAAQNAGCFISFDPNYRQLLFGHQQETFVTQSRHFLRHCHFFKVSDEEAILLTGADTVKQAALALREISPASFAITLGAEGTLLCHRNEQFVLPAVPVKVTDTTGAGDAFAGAVLFQLSQADSLDALTAAQWKNIVQRANRAGARTCEHMGAMEAFALLGKRLIEE